MNIQCTYIKSIIHQQDSYSRQYHGQRSVSFLVLKVSLNQTGPKPVEDI